MTVDYQLRAYLLAESVDWTPFGGPVRRLYKDNTPVSEADLKAAGFIKENQD